MYKRIDFYTEEDCEKWEKSKKDPKLLVPIDPYDGKSVKDPDSRRRIDNQCRKYRNFLEDDIRRAIKRDDDLIFLDIITKFNIDAEKYFDDLVNLNSFNILTLLFDNSVFNEETLLSYPEALHIGAENGYVETVDVLIAYGADIDYLDEEGNSALLLASDSGFYEIVELLLENNADPTLVNNRGYTAIDLAADDYMAELIESYLVEF